MLENTDLVANNLLFVWETRWGESILGNIFLPRFMGDAPHSSYTDLTLNVSAFRHTKLLLVHGMRDGDQFLSNPSLRPTDPDFLLSFRYIEGNWVFRCCSLSTQRTYDRSSPTGRCALRTHGGPVWSSLIIFIIFITSITVHWCERAC